MPLDPNRKPGEFNGRTVVVETNDGFVRIGRCSRFEEGNLILVHLDEVKSDEIDKSAYLKKALQFGHWPRVEKVFIPLEAIDHLELLKLHPLVQ